MEGMELEDAAGTHSLLVARALGRRGQQASGMDDLEGGARVGAGW